MIKLKKIILSLMFIIMLSSINAETDISVELTTDQNIDSTIVENSEGSITNDIFCNGASCSTNIYSGDVIVPDGQEFSYNDYKSYTTSNYDRSGGFSFSSLLNNLANVISPYLNNDKTNVYNNAWDFLSLLDLVFVSHKEFNPVANNVNYLASEVDRLKAQNEMLMEYLNLSLNSETLECRAALNEAIRTGQEVRTKSGLIANPRLFGMDCKRIE